MVESSASSSARLAKRRLTAHGTPACSQSRAWVLLMVLESAAGGFTTRAPRRAASSAISAASA
jgi:hypothetical protein